MENDIDEILEEEETETEESSPTENINEVSNETPKKKKMDLSYLDKPAEEWTVEDVANAQRATKTLQFQKKHFQDKANSAASKTETKETKTNTEQPINVLEEMDIRFLKRDGVSDEDLEQLKFIQAAQANLGKPVTLIEAQINPLYQAYQATKSLEDKKIKSQIISNGGGLFKDGKEISQEEREATREKIANDLLSQM